MGTCRNKRCNGFLVRGTYHSIIDPGFVQWFRSARSLPALRSDGIFQKTYSYG